MNTVFPLISSTRLADAKPGSIIRFFRSDESLFALVTNQKTAKTPALVLLNAKFNDRPPVLFADSWRDENCIDYNNEAHFEIGTTDELTDPRGNEWWETAGTIVLIGDKLLIRAVEFQNYGFSQCLLIDIQTGELFTDSVPNDTYAFGKWSLTIRTDRNQRLELCSFQVAKRQRT
jgi:hypothetical protein